MKIGLIDVDGFGNKQRGWGGMAFPNLALCKIASYHKQCGDSVEWYEPLFSGHCDIVYMSKVFNFSPEFPYPVDADVIEKGGTGYDITKVLPSEIDSCVPDFSIYPNAPHDTSFGFLTRGCPNKCKWCVVPRKEGMVRPYMDIEEVAQGRKNVVLMDNNILACGDYAIEQLEKIVEKGYRIDFNQAMDARLVDDRFAELLAKAKWINSRIRFGCDTKQQIAHCERAIEMISRYGFKGEFFLYTMLQGSFSECYNRLTYWWERNQELRKSHRSKIYPYAQPYRDPFGKNVVPQWQKDMASWCNKKQIFETCSFSEFQPRKNFTCDFYIRNLI